MRFVLIIGLSVGSLCLAGSAPITTVSGALKKVKAAKTVSYAIQEVPLEDHPTTTKRFFKLRFKRTPPKILKSLRENSLIRVQGTVSGKELLVGNDPSDFIVIATLEEGTP